MEEAKRQIQRLIVALTNIDELYYQASKRNRLKESEVTLLYALNDGKPHSQKEICDTWLLPKTTLNTVTREYESKGLITLSPISGTRREMQMTLTEAGKRYAEEKIAFIYEAEETAMWKTLEQYSTAFITAIETFRDNLRNAFEEQI